MTFFQLLTYILKYPNVEQDIKVVATQQNLKNFSPLIMNRYLSFHEDFKVKRASMVLNKYIFSIKDSKVLFELMCTMTPPMVKTFIQYVSKPKKDKYPDSIVNILKAYYGNHFNTDEITDIIDYLYRVDKKELIKVCMGSGMSEKEFKKIFKNDKSEVSQLKLESSEKRKYIKVLKNSKPKNVDSDII